LHKVDSLADDLYFVVSEQSELIEYRSKQHVDADSFMITSATITL